MNRNSRFAFRLRTNIHHLLPLAILLNSVAARMLTNRPPVFTSRRCKPFKNHASTPFGSISRRHWLPRRDLVETLQWPETNVCRRRLDVQLPCAAKAFSMADLLFHLRRRNKRLRNVHSAD
jgi:hypothetical protein